MASLVQKILEVKELYQMGFRMPDARRFVSDLHNKENDTVSFPSWCINSQTGGYLLDKLAKAPHIKNLDLKPQEILLRASGKPFNSFLENINKTGITSLTLGDIPALQKFDINFEKLENLSIDDHGISVIELGQFNLKNSHLKSLSFKSEIFYQDTIDCFSRGLPDSLRDISLKCKSGDLERDEIETMIGSLPLGTESLSLSGFKYDADFAEVLAAKLPSLPHLKNLKIGGPDKKGVSDSAMKILTEPLAKSNIENITFTGANVSDKTVNKFLDKIEPPPNLIYKLSFEDEPQEKKEEIGLNIPPPPHRASKRAPVTPPVIYTLENKTLERIAALEKRRQSFSGVLKGNTEKAKPNEKNAKEIKTPQQPPEQAEITSPAGLFKAAQEKRIEEAYAALNEKGMNLRTADYMQTNDEKYKLIDVLAYTKQLDKVFNPQNWSSAKDMQAVYDQIAVNQRYQVDGKEGRPSFTKNKFQLMQDAVKNAVAGKMKDR